MLRPKYMWFQYLVMFMFTLYFDSTSAYMGLLIPLVVIADFLRSLGKKIPIRELILATLSVQCLLVPFFYYQGYIAQSLIHPMAVDMQTYFSFLSPAFLFLAVGISIWKEEYYDFTPINKDRFFKIGKSLIIVGILSDFLFFFVPGGLAFFVKLLTYVKFIGAYYVLFSDHRNSKYWIALSFLNVAIIAIYQTVFQELLGWGLFFVIYLFYKLNLRKITQMGIVGSLLIGVFILQDVKINYRKALSEREDKISFDSAVSTFANEYVESTTNEETFSEESYSSNFVRFNQGYIISRILYHMPKGEPFANGESIGDAFYSALVPRFLDPNKITVGGGNGLYSRFTGYILVGGTSMDLSVFGEIYANYGKSGGIFTCLLLGLFYNLVIFLILRNSQFVPHLVLWIPYLCLIMVRPENSFAPIMNHLFKAAMVLFIIYHVYLKYEPLKAKFRLLSPYSS